MFEKNGRKNVAAWTAAVISGNPKTKVDVRFLEQIIEQLITNDCRVIEESLVMNRQELPGNSLTNTEQLQLKIVAKMR